MFGTKLWDEIHLRLGSRSPLMHAEEHGSCKLAPASEQPTCDPIVSILGRSVVIFEKRAPSASLMLEVSIIWD